MMKTSLKGWIIPTILLFSLLLAACSGRNSTADEAPAPAEPEVYSNLSLNITPDTQLDRPITVSKGAMIRVSAQEFIPEAKFRIYLGAPGTDYKDPAATGKTDAEGKTTTIFNIPQKWDDGQPVTQDELLIIVESGEGEVSLTLKIGYINE